MKKIKKISIILSLILIIILTIIFLPKDDNILKTNDNSKIFSNKNIALMLEQDDGNYNESTSNNWPDKEIYIFNPFLSKCDKGGKLSYDEGKNVVNVKSTKTEKCYLYFDEYNYENYCKYSDDNSFVCDILRTKDKTLIYHDGSNKVNGTIIDAQDDSYRYSGSNDIVVSNYVCLENDNSAIGECNDNDLYRIIGLFKNKNNQYEVKLIKYKSYANDTYYWTGSKENKKNIWKDSTLNTEILNKNYLNSLPGYVQSKITMHNFVTGGNTFDNISKKYVYESYKFEIKNPFLGDYASEEDMTYNAKIALMYATDYGFGAYKEGWTAGTLYEYGTESIKSNNWLYISSFEWLLTRISGSSTEVYSVYNNGAVSAYLDNVYNYKYIARPVFYLSYSTKAKSGNGTKDTPYRIVA